MLRRIDRVMVPDLNVAATFYAEVLGQRRRRQDDSAVGLGMAETDAEVVLHTMELPADRQVHYLVDDVPAAVERYSRRGCVVREQPFDVAVGRCAVLEDPFGNTLCILDLSKGLRHHRDGHARVWATSRRGISRPSSRPNYRGCVRTLDELILDDRSAWPEIEAFVSAAPYPVEVLPAEAGRAASCLEAVQVTTASWMGAVVYHSGGILIDHGWLRVFGSGERDRGLVDIVTAQDGHEGGVLIGVDVLGGQFAWAASDDEGAKPTVHYFAPDSLEWQDLGRGYSDWLYSMLTGSVDQFYENLRWPGWSAEVDQCGLDQGINVVPPLCTAEGKDIARTSRKAVPMAELVGFHHELASQLDGAG